MMARNVCSCSSSTGGGRMTLPRRQQRRLLDNKARYNEKLETDHHKNANGSLRGCSWPASRYFRHGEIESVERLLYK